MTNNLESKVIEGLNSSDSMNKDYSVKSSDDSYFGRFKQGFSSFKKNIKKKILPVVLGGVLLYGGVSCDLSNPYNVSETQDREDKIVILMNTDLPSADTYLDSYESLDSTKITLIRDANYNSEDIYVLGHDPTNLQFENYRQLTRDNLVDLMQEINEKYSSDAFLMINSIGHAGLIDITGDSNPDCFLTNFYDGPYYSYEYPDLVYSFLRDDRRVLLNINKCYAGYVIDAFVKNPKDNVLVFASSKKDEETIERSFFDWIERSFDNRLSKYYDLNDDNILSGQEVFDRIDSILGPAYSRGTPQMWVKNTTDPSEFIIKKL